MFHINNSIKLSFPQLLLIILFLLMLVCSYNKGYVTRYYYTTDKYEQMRKKYKSALIKCAEELNETQQLVEAQNSIIIEMQQNMPTDTQNVQNIGTATSSHGGALTGARFMSSKDPEVMHQHAQTLAPHLPTGAGIMPPMKTGPGMAPPTGPPSDMVPPNPQIQDMLSTPIDQLISQSGAQQQKAHQPNMPHMSAGSMPNQQQPQFDTFWNGSGIQPSNANGSMTLL